MFDYVLVGTFAWQTNSEVEAFWLCAMVDNQWLRNKLLNINKSVLFPNKPKAGTHCLSLQTNIKPFTHSHF